MAIKFVSIKCPECGASLDVEEGRQQIFCSYCGTKVMVQNDNEFIYRHIDEADIKQAETDRIIKLRQLELDSREDRKQNVLIFVWLSAAIILSILGIIGMCIENEGLETCLILGIDVALLGGFGLFNNKKKRRRVLASNEAVISESMEWYHNKNYNAVVMLFRSAGFNNISAVPMNDLNLFTLRNNGKVASVSINGVEDFEEGDVFPKSAYVTITYHSSK